MRDNARLLSGWLTLLRPTQKNGKKKGALVRPVNASKVCEYVYHVILIFVDLG